MPKARAKPNLPSAPAYVTPPIDPVCISALADRVQAGDVVQAGSIDEFCALLAELQRRGYALRERSEAEKQRAPFTFQVALA
jgi:hypothetical protein